MFTPIDPKKAYEEKTFVKSAAHMSGLEELVGKTDQHTPFTDEDTEMAGNIIFDNPNAGYGLDVRQLQKASRTHRKDAREKMSAYAKNNFDALFGQLDEEALRSYLLNPRIGSLHKIGDEELDKAVNAANELREIAIARQTGDVSKYLANKRENATDALKNCWAALTATPNGVAVLIEGYERQASEDLRYAITKEVKKGDKVERVLDKSKLTNIITGSLSAAEKAKKAEPYYLALADLAYQKLAA